LFIIKLSQEIQHTLHINQVNIDTIYILECYGTKDCTTALTFLSRDQPLKRKADAPLDTFEGCCAMDDKFSFKEADGTCRPCTGMQYKHKCLEV